MIQRDKLRDCQFDALCLLVLRNFLSSSTTCYCRLKLATLNDGCGRANHESLNQPIDHLASAGQKSYQLKVGALRAPMDLANLDLESQPNSLVMVTMEKVKKFCSFANQLTTDWIVRQRILGWLID